METNPNKIMDAIMAFIDENGKFDFQVKPFLHHGRLVATDGHAMCIMPAKKYGDFRGLNINHDREFFKYIPHYPMEWVDVEVDDFKKFIDDNVSLVDEMKTEDEECPTCDGCGVDWDDDLCDECDGLKTIEIDKPTGDKIKNTSHLFSIDGVAFTYYQINRVLTFFQALRIDKFKMKYGVQHDPMLIESGDIQIVMAGTMFGAKHKPTMVNLSSKTN